MKREGRLLRELGLENYVLKAVLFFQFAECCLRSRVVCVLKALNCQCF